MRGSAPHFHRIPTRFSDCHAPNLPTATAFLSPLALSHSVQSAVAVSTKQFWTEVQLRTLPARMPLELQEVDSETDFPSLARCLFESYEKPPQRFFHVFFPIHGTTEGDREEAIYEAAVRLKLWHTHDPSSYWQKVVDTKTGRIAGGALWNIHKENPFASPPASEVTWFPNDGSRRFVEKALENHARPRSQVAQRPHLYLFIVFTHPDYRRKGVGQQFMDWGIKKADEMGVEFFLDSTPYGRPLYEANGFEYIEENVNIPVTEAPDEEWKAVEDKVGPFTFWLMWRPVSGKYGAGKTARPWETD
ncbi:putative N-acetyltransferase domain-containing protein [Seiridium cardinale]|uniref:N-acetyltransferase domain-containing protein n=1 Tax=Seiridium cardinale TaxID=138064 RepID=A0ABR2XRL5_9PEZI